MTHLAQDQWQRSMSCERSNKSGRTQVGAIFTGQQIGKVGKKIDDALREMKTLYPNFENVISEL